MKRTEPQFTIAVAAMAVISSCSTAQACDPPHVGDQFRYNDGTVMEIAEPVNSNDCHWERRKVCMRPVGSKQPCRWVKFPSDYKPKDGRWILTDGVSQD